jgi:putative addiction module component (TIGR02574 family)
MTKAEILQSARELPPQDQLELAMELWNAIDSDAADLPLTDDLRAELDRRLEEFERSPGDARPWEEVRADILQHLKKQ